MIEEQIGISQKVIPGITPNYIISGLKELPMVHEHWKKNSEENQKYLIDVFMKMPSKADVPGYIYGFREKEGYNSSDKQYWIKMGRTNRATPQTRIFEWQKTDKHQYSQIFTVRSEYNNKLESLMHLVFAYARKVREINGNRRIQWFQFGQKVPTAAITNLVNLFMEKIHEKYIEKLKDQVEDKVPSFYNDCVENLNKKNRFSFEEFNIVVFGLPKTGKSTFGRLVQGDKILVEKKDKVFMIGSKESSEIKHFIQISDNERQQTDQQAVQNYFITWQKLCNSKKLLPILVVKQSDVESSKLVGLTQGFRLIQKYIKASKLIIVVTHASKDFTPEAAKDVIIQNRQFLRESELKMFANSEFFVIKKPQIAGSLLSNDQRDQLQKRLSTWKEELSIKGGAWGQIHFRMDQKYLNVCNEIIDKSYEALQGKLAENFKLRLNQHLEQDLKIDFIDEIRIILERLKSEDYQSHQVVHTMGRKLMGQLELKSKQQIQTYLYLFCELSANNSMLYSQLMTLLDEQVKEAMLVVMDNLTIELQTYLDPFRDALSEYKRSGKEQLGLLLIEINEKNTFEGVVDKLSQVIKIGKGKMEQQSQKLAMKTEGLIGMLKKINQMARKGIRLDLAFGKVRQSIFYGLRSELQIPKVGPFKLQKQRQEPIPSYNTSSLLDQYKQQNISTMSVLQKKIAQYPQGKSIVNVVQQFIFDAPPKSQSIKHNLFILSKSVKLYEECSITFKGVYDSAEKKTKLYFMVFAQNFANIGKLAMPQRSPNGFGYLIELRQGKIQVLRKPKNDQISKQKNEALEALKKIYEKNIK